MAGTTLTRPERVARTNSDFTELAAVIRDSGLLRRRYVYYWARLLAVPIGFGAGVVALVLLGDSWWQLCTAVYFGLFFGQAAFLGHDAAHRQIFRSGPANEWAALLVGDLFVGMSLGWWKHKHTRHHANPNKQGSDPDLAVPELGLSREQASRPRPRVIAWMLAHQGAFFFPILPLEGISLQVSSVRRVLAREPVDHRAVEIVLLAVRFVGFAALVFLVMSPGIAVAFLALQSAVFGFYMGATFAPNHKGMAVLGTDSTIGFLRRQVVTSRNISGGRLVDWAMGGLNYQIEHHLFPSMPSLHLRRAAPVIARYCRERGIPYTRVSLLSSYATVVRYINRVGLGHRDPFDCPLVADRTISAGTSGDVPGARGGAR